MAEYDDGSSIADPHLVADAANKLSVVKNILYGEKLIRFICSHPLLTKSSTD